MLSLRLNMLSLQLKNEQDTERLAKLLVRYLPESCICYLTGDLGAGKTTLIRYILQAMGYQGKVKSPTYTLVEPYQWQDKQLFHFDLYRLADPEELEFMGIRDYFDAKALCFIEWPQMGDGFLPEPDLHIKIALHDDIRDVELLFDANKVKLPVEEFTEFV